MNGKLIPVFVLAALMSCSQPPVKEQGPPSGKVGGSDLIESCGKSRLAVSYRRISSVIWPFKKKNVRTADFAEGG